MIPIVVIPRATGKCPRASVQRLKEKNKSRERMSKDFKLHKASGVKREFECYKLIESQSHIYENTLIEKSIK